MVEGAREQAAGKERRNVRLVYKCREGREGKERYEGQRKSLWEGYRERTSSQVYPLLTARRAGKLDQLNVQ